MQRAHSRETSKRQEIKVSVLGVKQLTPRENGNALRKAFCKLRLGAKKQRTQTIKQVFGLNSSIAHLDSKPEESFLFSVPETFSGDAPHLSVSVWDYNRFSWSVFLGEAYIPLVPGVTHVEHWYPLDDWHDQQAVETTKYSSVGGFVKVRVEWCQDESEKRNSVRITSIRIERMLDAFFELQGLPSEGSQRATSPPLPVPGASSPRDIRPAAKLGSSPSSPSSFFSLAHGLPTPPAPASSGSFLSWSPPRGSPLLPSASRDSPQLPRRMAAGASGGAGGLLATSSFSSQHESGPTDYRDGLIDDYIDADIMDRSGSVGAELPSSDSFGSPGPLRASGPSPLALRRGSRHCIEEPDALENEDLSDFNSRFQKITEKIRTFGRLDADFDTKLTANRELLNLTQDFQHTVVQYGKIIISERYLPVSQKTIQPVPIGGIAGGDKYLVHSILFKFAVDSRGLYGGNDSLAAKVASNELRSIISWYNMPAETDICVPMACILDYKGFRLIAMSWLPIHKGTLKYGSEDAGKTVIAEDPTFNEMMRTGCTTLKLKKHIAGLDEKTAKEIYSCVDIEGHKGTDNRYYIVDLSRLFPPMTPSEDVQRSYLVRLFRPEFLRAYHKPLCSDGFSRFIRNDPDREHYNDEIREATTYLLETVVPDFAKQLLSLYQDWKTKGETPDRFPLVMELHRSGINVRLIGRVAENLEYSKFPDDKPTLASINELRWLLIMEMVARVIKHNIRVGLQEKMKQLRVPLDEPYRRFTIDYINRVFGSEGDSRRCWQEQLARDVEKKFEVDLNAIVPFRTEPARGSRSNSNMSQSDRFATPFKAHSSLNARLLKSSSDLSDDQISPPESGLRSPSESVSPPPARSKSFFSVLGWSGNRAPVRSSRSPGGTPLDSPSIGRLSISPSASPVGTPDVPRSGAPRTGSPVLSPREKLLSLPPKGSTPSAGSTSGAMTASPPLPVPTSANVAAAPSSPPHTSESDSLRHSASDTDVLPTLSPRGQRASIESKSESDATSGLNRARRKSSSSSIEALTPAPATKGHHRRRSSEDSNRRARHRSSEIPTSTSPPRHDVIGVSASLTTVPPFGRWASTGMLRSDSQTSPIAASASVSPRGPRSQPPSPRHDSSGAVLWPAQDALHQSSPGHELLRHAGPVLEGSSEYSTAPIPPSPPAGSSPVPEIVVASSGSPASGRLRTNSTPTPLSRVPSESKRLLFGPEPAVTDEALREPGADPTSPASVRSSSPVFAGSAALCEPTDPSPALVDNQMEEAEESATCGSTVAPSKFVQAIPRNQQHRKFTGTGSDTFAVSMEMRPSRALTSDLRRRSRTAPTASFNFQMPILGAERWLFSHHSQSALGLTTPPATPAGVSQLDASVSSSGSRARATTTLLASSSGSASAPAVVPDTSTLSQWLTAYSPFESKSSVDSRMHIIQRLVKMSGMRISHRAVRYLEDGRAWRKMHYEDLHDVGERVKHMNIINHALGVIYKIRSWQYSGEDRLHLLHKAQKCFEAALEMDPNSALTLRNLAQLQTLMDDAPTLSYLSPRVEKANEYYLRALETNPTDRETLFQYASFQEQCGLLDSALEYLLRVAELGEIQEAYIGLLLKIVSKMDVSDLSESCREKLNCLASDSRDFRRRRHTVVVR
eukprot:TRINITY_DN7502_c0_g1_i1.p1 TRINITY_DN7502_c0_g1~~TRINITY_DN7502_c0_g1_i1.p1  ORF type:complete len:1638 (+),score=449.85 TRINITY_DN7502_c0_g1_i1:121-5034(+)